MHPKRTTTPPQTRFWAKVDRSGSCWLWIGAVDPISGYGKFSFKGKIRNAHTVSWELIHGLIPSGLCVLHDCDRFYAPGDITYRRCVNPDHLWTGTNADNTHDMFKKGRGAVGDRHPARTHPDYLPRGDAHRARWDGSYLPRGEAHVNAKLTAERVQAIRHRYAAGGISLHTLAQEYGVTAMAVHGIVRRKTWRHVP